MSYVYLITTGKVVKIGITDDPKKRLAKLQTGHYERLRIYCTFHCLDRKTATQLEGLLHARYAYSRLEGEWFRINPDKIIDDVYSSRTLRTLVISHEVYRTRAGEAVSNFVSKKKQRIYDSIAKKQRVDNFIALGIVLVTVLLISLAGLISAAIPMYFMALLLMLAFWIVVSLTVTLVKEIYGMMTDY